MSGEPAALEEPTFAHRLASSSMTGARLALIAALVVATVDLVDTMASGFEGQPWTRGAYVYSSLALVFAISGGALGAWTAAMLRATSALSERWREPVRALLLGLPAGSFMAWVPTSWIIEHWNELNPTGSAIALSVYPALFAIATALAWLTRRWLRRSPHTAPRHWLTFASVLALAAASYLADRTLYVGLYDDFHAGLTVTFASATAASVALLLQRGSGAARIASLLRPGALAGCLAGCVIVQAALEATKPDVFGPSSSAVFDKLASAIRSSTDFDGDGYSHLYGGSDCAPLDSQARPGNLDLPGDDIDDDCSGSAASWPKPAPAVADFGFDAEGYNVLLITIDALRADHLGAWGYSRNPTSPNLDALAARSIRFARAFSPSPKTYDTLPALVTGLYPVNVPRNYKAEMPKGQPKKHYLYRITDEVTLLPEILQRSGYVTGAAHGVRILRALGLERGFDEYEKTREATAFAQSFLQRHVLDASPRRPFFLWLHYYSPHHTYEKREGFDFGDSDINRYDSEIAHDDHQIGVLLKELERAGVAAKTLIVVTADHGEEFWEHGGTQHGFKLYSELTHVPLILSIPGQEAAVVDDPVEVIDIAPTLCSLLGVAEQCGARDGHNLLAALAGKRPEDRGAYSELYRKDDQLLMNSLYTGRWRVIFDYKQDRAELYDVIDDPGEQRDVSAQHPELVRKLRDRLATRTLYRQGLAFERYQATQDSVELAKRLSVFRRKRMLRWALRHIEDQLEPAHAPYLTELLKRPGLHRSNAKLARKLLARLPKAAHQQRTRAAPAGEQKHADEPATYSR